MAQDDLLKQGLSYLASGSGQKKTTKPSSNSVGSILAGASKYTAPNVDNSNPDDEWYNKPVIKQILDALSVGTYTAGNVTNDAIDRIRNSTADGSVSPGEVFDIINPLHGFEAIGKGIAASFGGQDQYKKTQSQAIKKIQEMAGIDTESDASRLVQGIGGFIGDVAFDPTTYVGAGLATAAVKGAVRGGTVAKAQLGLEAKIGAEKAGSVTAEGTRTVGVSRLQNARMEAAKEVDLYRKHKYDVAQAKEALKQLKKKKNPTDNDLADFLIEHVQGLRPGVYKAVAKKIDDREILVQKVDELNLPEEQMAAHIAKADESIPESALDPVDIVREEPRLSTYKPVTTEEKLFDALGEYRTTNKKPRYAQDVIGRVNAFVAAKGLDKIKDSDLVALGVENSDTALIKQGTPIQNLISETSDGDIRYILRDINNGTINDQALKPLAEIAGTTDRKEIVKFIKEKSSKNNPLWAEARANIGKYGTYRTGENPLPHLGVSGHGKLAQPGKGYTPADILSAKTPANPEQSKRYLEAIYNFHAQTIAMHKDGAKWRAIADDIFARSVGEQAVKYAGNWNTHSAIYRISETMKAVRALGYKRTDMTTFDNAFMSILSDIDNRLRLNGIDPHLSNMKMAGDKLVVRLGPSDVFSSMTYEMRKRYLYGNKFYTRMETGSPKGSSINEFLPTTLMDLAETMVRSATQLTAEGKIDYQTLTSNAFAALNGWSVRLGKGPRELEKTLDVFSNNKANQEILNEIDLRLGTKFGERFNRATSQEAKDAVIKTASEDAKKLFTKISAYRMNTLPNQMINMFLEGVSKGESSILSDLINKNMRNASVFGGSVAREIGDASAQHTQRLLDTLESGTLGEHLSAVASKIRIDNADPGVHQILDDNRVMATSTVADAAETRHAEASMKNVGGDPADGPKHNAEAFQKDPDLQDEFSKPYKEINTEKAFDLAWREANADMLIRAFGSRRWFNKRAGLNTTYDIVTSSAHAANLWQTGMHGILRGWRGRGITDGQLDDAMKALQTGEIHAEVDPNVMDEVKRVMDDLFDPSKSNFLARNSVGPNHFNKILESVGFDPKKYFIPEDTPQELINEVWKNWTIDNVPDFLSKLARAVTKTAEDVSIGAGISKHFGSATPGKGLTKLVDAKGENPLFPLIDQSLYYPQEVANEFVYIGRLMTESRSFKPGTNLHTFVTKVMDPVIQTLKMTQTTLKPGHHVMSVIGDAWRNNLALSTIGYANPSRQLRLYADSYNVIRSAFGDIEELSDFDKFTRIQKNTTGLKIGPDGESARVVREKGDFQTFSNIGKGGKITNKDLYALMQNYGVALPAHLGGMAEDYTVEVGEQMAASGSSQLLNKIGNAVTGTAQRFDRFFNPLTPKYNQHIKVNKWTANRDTWTRGVMFLGAMRSKNFKTVEEAANYAANFVKKWAPTALDFGGVEAKYARRMIFYYTWIRGMVPRIIESALMRPGVALAPNKLMYNIAEANGVDLRSIGDPFPDGTLFPSWYSQKVIGPQANIGGDLWGINPTGPVGDILNTLGSNVQPKDFVSPDAFTKTAGTFLNMSTPWFKAPAELTLGQTLQNNIPIVDPGQYVQDMFGPARTVSRLTGKELFLEQGPNGLAFPNRTESKYRNGMSPDQASENTIQELLNWASGLNVTNYTSDSAQSSAMFQQREQAAAERKNAQRFMP